jgi:uncharacterized membrane protein
VRRRLVLTALVLSAVMWNSALLAAPRGTPRLVAASTFLAGTLICHQRADRSFHIGGAQMPVCARCTGLYVGALMGVVVWMLVAGLGSTISGRGRRLATARGARRALIISALPTMASVALAWAGVWDGNNAVRALLALPLGATAAAVVAAVAARDLR